MKKITNTLLAGSMIASTLLLSGCGTSDMEATKAPTDTTKLIRGVADDHQDWTWFVGTDGTKDANSAAFTSYFMQGVPNEVQHFQYFLDTDNNAQTGFSFGEDSWRISGADILVEDGEVYKSQSTTEWKWSHVGTLDNYTRSSVENIEQINFAGNKTLLGITSDTINVTIEPFDANWGSTYSTISTQAVTLVDNGGVGEDPKLLKNSDNQLWNKIREVAMANFRGIPKKDHIYLYGTKAYAYSVRISHGKPLYYFVEYDLSQKDVTIIKSLPEMNGKSISNIHIENNKLVYDLKVGTEVTYDPKTGKHTTKPIANGDTPDPKLTQALLPEGVRIDKFLVTPDNKGAVVLTKGYSEHDVEFGGIFEYEVLIYVNYSDINHPSLPEKYISTRFGNYPYMVPNTPITVIDNEHVSFYTANDNMYSDYIDTYNFKTREQTDRIPVNTLSAAVLASKVYKKTLPNPNYSVNISGENNQFKDKKLSDTTWLIHFLVGRSSNVEKPLSPLWVTVIYDHVNKTVQVQSQEEKK